MNSNNKIRLMIVDDEKTALDIIINSILWQEYNIEAIAATDGEHALQIIANQMIDIVITDIKMPRIDGLELIRRINSLERKIICIVMSSYNEFDLVRAAMQLGAFDYLFKPTMMPEDIIKVVQDIAQKMEEKKEIDLSQKELFYNTNKKEIFEVLLNNSELNKQMKRDLIQKLQIENIHFVSVMKLQLKHYQERLKWSFYGDYELMRFTIENILNEIGKDQIQLEVVTVNFYEYYLIVWTQDREETEAGFETRLVDFTVSSKKIFDKYYDFTCHYGISHLETDFEKLFLQRLEVQSYIEKAETTGQLRISYLDGDFAEFSTIMKSALDYILDNLCSKELSLQTVSDYVGLSKNYFSRLFKEETKMNFLDYVTKKKLEKAKQLYATTEMKVYEISEKLGYSDWHYLYALYKKEYGHSLSKEKKSTN